MTLLPTRRDDGMTASEPLLVEHRGPVAIVTLNRPDRLNALGPDNALPTLHALNGLREDDSSRVVVLTGAGRAFCSGMDLVAGLDIPGHGQVQGRYLGLERAAEVLLALRDIPQPVIAAIHGHAVGAGLALAAMADIRVADTTARFGPVFTRRGFSGGDLGASWWLPRLIGFAHAAEMLYTAEPFDAHRASEMGFVTHLVAEGADVDTAVAIGEKIAVNAPFGVSQTKNLLNTALGIGDLRQHMTTEIRTQVLCSFTDDVGEGISAAIQRRTPTFSNS
jgi:enoyl-CoA hydratase